MTEMTIYGRGGQGGVTLAKLIASAYFLKGKHAQAFGVYAAERSGAPLQAFVRIDDEEITNHNQVREPDYVVVLDRTLIAPRIIARLKEDGWIVLNTAEPPTAFAEQFPGCRVATVDATAIAVENGLGTRTVPIVNTTIFGAVANVLDLTPEDVKASLASVNFGGPNVVVAQRAFATVRTAELAGKRKNEIPPAAGCPPAGVLDPHVGGRPQIRTGDWATRTPERQRLTPPCNQGCPAGNDVQGFIRAVAEKDHTRALEILLRTTPMPGICGRVCPAPCMATCNRQFHDEAVNIRELERYVAEHGHRPEPTKPTRDERVAIVGSGPAGLSAAYHLSRFGYRVTIHEKGEELGGVMRTGIPNYRLPRDVLDKEISYILRHGVEAKTGQAIGRAELLELTHEYAAVFVGTGLQNVRSVDLGPDSDQHVTDGIAFLDSMRKHRQSLQGRRVIVIGGGNTAVDAARTAKRLGAASVHIVYRRTRNEMPAIKEEIDEALEERIVLDELVAPLRIHRDEAGPLLTCNRMRLGEPDESGRRRPVPEFSEDAKFDMRYDLVILALGQTPDVSIAPEGAEIRENENLLGLSGAPVFAGGDFAATDGTVAAAIGSARRASLHIHRTLSGEDCFPAQRPPASAEHITMHVFSHSPSERGAVIPPRFRTHSFAEVRLGLVDEPGHEPAVTEAQRCFSCGVCNECDLCLNYCPDGCVIRDGNSYRFDYDYCKGCGVCASVCPRAVIYMAEL